ncbi:MAG TPA: hypothetical protein VN622_02565 [Clostridia bacterium]|nr:hypothetical protein [Clostridia bacterium]
MAAKAAGKGSTKGRGIDGRKSGAKSKPTGRSTGRKVDRQELIRKARNRVYREIDGVVHDLIEEAKKGSHTTAKFLFEFAGVDKVPFDDGEQVQAQDSLTILLKSLGVHNDVSAGETADVAGQKSRADCI